LVILARLSTAKLDRFVAWPPTARAQEIFWCNISRAISLFYIPGLGKAGVVVEKCITEFIFAEATRLRAAFSHVRLVVSVAPFSTIPAVLVFSPIRLVPKAGGRLVLALAGALAPLAGLVGAGAVAVALHEEAFNALGLGPHDGNASHATVP